MTKNVTVDLTFFSGSGKESVEELGVLLPHFKCFEIKNFGNKLFVGSKKDYNLYLVDKNRELNSRILNEEGKVNNANIKLKELKNQLNKLRIELLNIKGEWIMIDIFIVFGIIAFVGVVSLMIETYLEY